MKSVWPKIDPLDPEPLMMKSVFVDVLDMMSVDVQYHDLVEDLVEIPVRGATWGRIAWLLREDLG